MKKLFAILLSLAMLVCFMPTMAFAGGTAVTAKTVYVNAAATGTADGTTEATGYRTVGEAITAAVAGDTIKVVGTYSEPVNATSIDKNIIIDGGGTAVFKQPVNLQSESNDIAVIGMKFESINCGATANALTISTTGVVTVQGNTFNNITGAGADASGMAISVWGSNDTNITTNKISGTYHNAIHMEGSANGSASVMDNIIYNWGTGKKGRAMRIAFASSGEHNVRIIGNVMKDPATGITDKGVYLKLTDVSQATKVDLQKNYWGSEKPDWTDNNATLNKDDKITSVIATSDRAATTAITGIKDKLFPYLKYEKDSSYLITDANGTTVYNDVDERIINVDTNGTDATADGSLEAPFKTIGAAAIEATKIVGNKETSDVIRVAVGTYGGAVNVAGITRPLTVEGTGNVVLNAPLKLVGTAAITVQNLKIKNLTSTNMANLDVALEIKTTGKIVIQNNTIDGVKFNDNNTSGTGMGIRVEGSDGIIVQNNTISNTQHNGINLGGATATSTMLIDSNTITNWGNANDQGRAMRIGFNPTTPATSNVTITNNVMSNTDANFKSTTDDGFYLKLTDVTESATVDLSHNYWGAKAPDFIGTGAIFSKDDKITSVIATSDRAANNAITNVQAKLFPFYQDASKYYLQNEDGSVEYKGPSTPSTPPTPEKPKEEVVTQPDGSTITTTTEKDKATGAEIKSEVVKDKDGKVTAKTEATAPVKSEVTGTTATATVGKDVADKLLEQTKAAEKKAAASGATKSESTITLDVKTAGTVAKAEVSLPADTLGKIANETSASVKVETSVGAIEFDQKALQEITKGQTTGNVKLVAEIINTDTMPQEVQDKLGENAMVVDLSVQTDAGKITDFNGGSATVSIAIPAGIDPTKLGAVYIRTDGKLERVEGKVVIVNGKPVFQFLTGHFSKYAILDKETIDKTIAAQNAKLVKGVKATKILAAKAVAKKGNATVTWKKSPGYKVDGYQIWKSSKKTSGYKMMAKRTGQQYKNTYGLKAGKTYYYKVRGFRAIDGKNVYTKWAQVKVVAK